MNSRIRREWKQIEPAEIRSVLIHKDPPPKWPDFVRFKDSRGEHTVLRILVEIEVLDGDHIIKENLDE